MCDSLAPMKKMQTFSIDFLTGNTAVPVYGGHGLEPSNKQGVTSDVNTMYYPPVQLEDVYSVISKDATVTSSLTSTLTSSLDIPTPSPDDVSRGTPSPTLDSGIESDHSPGHPPHLTLTTESIAETLKKLDETATKVEAKSSAPPTSKPGQSYLALIAKAILSSRDRKLTLGDIYRHIMDNNPYYNNGEKAWRGSIRYTLSINECFIKCGKDESGKGNFWGIHPNCLDDFQKGDYRRRQARRRARKTLKAAMSYNTPSPAQQTSGYTPMTSAYVYSPYAGYHIGAQDYGYGQMKHTGSTAAVNGYPSTSGYPQVHPAFNYHGYPGSYPYANMYPNIADTGYHKESSEKKEHPKYKTGEPTTWCLTDRSSDTDTRGEDSTDGTLMYNRIEIV